MALQALRDLFQPATETRTGQSLPTSETGGASRQRPSGPPPAGMNGGGFNPATMGSLLGSQEAGATPGSQIVDDADTDGDGTISIEELAASLQTEASSLTETFGEVDADGDGQITGAELDTSLKALFEKNGPPPPPSGADIASSLLGAADADSGGSLSLDEILSALGDEDDGGIADTFKTYDADGDEALNSEELTSAIEAMISSKLSAYAAQGQSNDWTTSLAA